MSPTRQPKHRQPWLKRVLIPFWVLQIIFMLVLIGLNAWTIADANYTLLKYVFHSLTVTIHFLATERAGD